MDISRAAWVGTWGAPSRQGMPNSYGAHPLLPPLRDSHSVEGRSPTRTAREGLVIAPPPLTPPAKPLNVPQAADGGAKLPPLTARPETREVLNPVREARVEAADTPTHPRYPRFCKNPIVNPFVARVLRGWTPPFQPVAPTRDLAQRRGSPDRHLRPRRRRQLSREAATFPAVSGSALPGPGRPRPQPGAALRWPSRQPGDAFPASAARDGP
ncbi:hypothetical protein P7K49_002335 [Saguinus oedipus]|uniref:Uncharacterized protein n=1 Tax=Saguinus oedipus TaxID=9490 RepID=A0ABQ9WH41_SAGOE|nr:hypothetical protein P7K49_002335 [Saguinus oedipus]